MATVIAYDDVKVNERTGRSKNDTVDVVTTPFLGGRDIPNLPIIALSKFPPKRLTTVHFHDVPQFQIMIEGKGKMGRHAISVNSVHFSRAYTPYGPFTADDESSLTCLIIRSRPDTGAEHDAEAIAQLRDMPNRNPWQATQMVKIPESGSAPVALEPVSGLQGENGQATYALRMKPGAMVRSPDPSTGDGMFVVVLKGSLLHEGKEAKGLTVVHITNKESPFDIRAGSEGLEGMIVQFPRGQSQPSFKQAQPQTKAWGCTLCSFVYDEAAGRPEEGIAPGTRWEDVPASWTCPDCDADKDSFERNN